MARKPKGPKQVGAFSHDDAVRRNIPTAEMESLFRREEDHAPSRPVHYPRATPLPKGEIRERDTDFDPQLIWKGSKLKLSRNQIEELLKGEQVELADAQLSWRGKDYQDWSDLVVQTPPIYIQEKIHSKAIIDDLKRRAAKNAQTETDAPDLFADFNGLPDLEARTEFYRHDQHWSNRMILGDSLQVMASLAERESLRGKVQCIYFDPPYGIKFGSNWQVSTQSRDVQDGKLPYLSREPEQVKAFRDTWKDGIHSYLTYLRDRLTVMRDLLTESGSIFVQISDENVHRIRTVLDEVFGGENFCSQISFSKTSGQTSQLLPTAVDFILWFAKNKKDVRFRRLFLNRPPIDKVDERYVCVETYLNEISDLSVSQKMGKVPIPEGRILKLENLTSQTGSDSSRFAYEFKNRAFRPGGSRGWSTSLDGLRRLEKAGYLWVQGNTLWWKSYRDEGRITPRLAEWTDTRSNAFGDDRLYVVQTNFSVIQNCILMCSDPGDLVLDPTCGSGTSAYVAEQWGRRWITIDTSRVALALARTRLMAARYPWYHLADSPGGRLKEGELTARPPADTSSLNDIRQGFVYERVPHVTLKSIANNVEIDVIWETWQRTLEPLRAALNTAVGKVWEEWEIPHKLPASASPAAKEPHAQWWEARISRQREIDESIARHADVEYLYDRPYSDPGRVRVAGPFTVESLSPHRVLPASDHELVDDVAAAEGKKKRDMADGAIDFAQIVIEHLKTAGVHQAEKRDAIRFSSVAPWPGQWIGAEGLFMEGETERRAGVYIGPEFGTVGRSDLVAAAREAADNRFDLLIACAFNFDAHSSEFGRLGVLQVLKAHMNPDLHMAGDLKNTGKGNLFVVFGEPDIDILEDDAQTLRVRVNGVDVFDPNTGEIRSNDTKQIAAWFIDTDYNEESFFVRHAYFLGANDPYKALKTALKAEIDEDAWSSLYGDTSRPFPRPKSGRIAVKVINHFGDEVMKIFGV